MPELFDLVSEGTDGEGGAGLVDTLQFAVADDLGIGVIDLQTSEQGDEGSTLGRSAGVGSSSFLVKTTLVADADGVGIVMPGMGTDHLFRATHVQLSVTGDIVVIATAFPAFGEVYVVEQLKRQVLVRAARRAEGGKYRLHRHGTLHTSCVHHGRWRYRLCHIPQRQ